MQISRLDHVNIRTANLDVMVQWYRDILGMETGNRPPFSFPGAWLYADGKAVIHLVGVERPESGIEPRIEHFALGASDFAGLVARLDNLGVAHTVDPVPGAPIVQINLHDPDGNHIHVDFSDEDANLD